MTTRIATITLAAVTVFALTACSDDAGGQASKTPPAATQKPQPSAAKIILLHHSTGENIWNGGLAASLAAHNRAAGTHYSIVEQAFPKDSPYGWNNYPYDYWNIWVRHAGNKPFRSEPTLEILTRQYDVIVWKHCFPVSNIEADTGSGDVASEDKRIENYKLQYAALKEKMRSFSKTRFIVWTGAMQVAGNTDAQQAARAKSFFDWVKTTWDEKGDNIYIWDFRALQTEGGLYFKAAYADGDAHPNEAFSRRAAPMLARRIVDVIAGRGDATPLIGGTPVAPAAVKDPTPPAAADTAPEAPRTVPVAAVAPAGKTWTFDDAETAARKTLWAPAGAYVADGGGHTIALDFSKGRAEDWGEYGRQRLIDAKPPKPVDVSGYRYLTMRVRADRDMELVVTLMTDVSATDHSYFSFTGYPRMQANRWKRIVLDLAALELANEGQTAYNAAGKPTRIKTLTHLRLVTNEKNARANVNVDDITFHTTRP